MCWCLWIPHHVFLTTKLALCTTTTTNTRWWRPRRYTSGRLAPQWPNKPGGAHARILYIIFGFRKIFSWIWSVIKYNFQLLLQAIIFWVNIVVKCFWNFFVCPLCSSRNSNRAPMIHEKKNSINQDFHSTFEHNKKPKNNYLGVSILIICCKNNNSFKFLWHHIVSRKKIKVKKLSSDKIE